MFFSPSSFSFFVVSATELWVANLGVTSPRRLLYSALEPTVSSPFMPMQPGQCGFTSFTQNLCRRWSGPILTFAVQHIWEFCTWVIGASPRWSIVKLTKWKAAMFSETPSNNTVYANQETKRGKDWGTNYTDVLYLHWTSYIGCTRFPYNYFPMPWFMHRPLSIVTMLCSLSFAPHPKSL